jgi:predicted DsbA family dithiol-disulfide isomerase
LGAATSGVLLASFVLGWSAWCPLCVIVHGINFALPPVLKSAAGLSRVEVGRRLAAAAGYFRGDTPTDAPAARWKVVGLFCAGLVAVVLYQWVLIEAVPRSPAGQEDFDPRKLATRFDASPLCEIPLGPDEARLGKPDAAVKLVVFSDFQCPGCARFSGELLDLARHYGERLQIVFKHYPLGAACNPTLKRDLHPSACKAARAAEAARRQGRFWEFHNALFASRRDFSLDEIARKLRLDVARFDADRQAAGVSDKVRSDVELGIRLGLDATPAVFLNGRRIHELETRALRFLIERELGRAAQSGSGTGSPPARVAQAW